MYLLSTILTGSPTLKILTKILQHRCYATPSKLPQTNFKHHLRKIASEFNNRPLGIRTVHQNRHKLLRPKTVFPPNHPKLVNNLHFARNTFPSDTQRQAKESRRKKRKTNDGNHNLQTHSRGFSVGKKTPNVSLKFYWPVDPIFTLRLVAI